jgi:DHA1 family tetracycline resistance protein-like MFS transporter
MSDEHVKGQPRRAAVVFIFVTVALDVLAFGVVIPVLPKLLEQLSGGDTAHAARLFGLFGAVWALMQFICSPTLGALSDRFGRRPIILISCFGLGLDYILMALAPTTIWLFVGRVLSGIMAASWSSANSYIADVTPPEKRAASFGLIGAAWGTGFVLGPALGGVLGSVDLRLPFWVAAALTLLNALYGVFVLPESLPPEKRRPFDMRRANPAGSLALLRSHHELLGLASLNVLYYLAHHVLPSVFVLYVTYRYGWTEQMVGLTLTGVGIWGIFVQARLVQPVVARFGAKRAILAGLFCGALGFTLYGLAPTSHAFWIAVPIGGLMALFGPAAQSLMSRRVSPSEQGQLQGTNASLMGLTGLVGPPVFTLTFASFISREAGGMNLPGAPFLLAAAMLLAAFLLAIWVTAGTADRGIGESHD